MKKLLSFILALIATGVTSSCDTLKSIPTNTTGGLFSLNGTWQLTASSDNSAMTGTIIVVLPVLGNASVKTLANNTYCVRENDAYWKTIKPNGNGGFTLSNLVSACNGTPVYKDGTISVVNTDKISVTTRTSTNSELIQAWDRVKK
jgi:hypothetical protein